MSTSLQEIVYRSRFTQWDQRAGVRTKPRRLVAEPDPTLSPFPARLAPVATHPLVRAQAPDLKRYLLVQSLYHYLDFTVELEQQIVNPTCCAISRDRLGLILPARMRHDAFNIYTDEAWHAQVADDLQSQVVAAIGISPLALPPPAFVTALRTVKHKVPSVARPFIRSLFAIVSETLISQKLLEIPRDKQVLPTVRAVVADHAADESIHHAYFAALLRHIWNQLPASQRLTVAAVVPDLIRTFLSPDLSALATILHAAGVSESDTGQILSDCYPDDQIDIAIRKEAKATLRHFAEVGLFTDPAALEAFQLANLVEA
jgi:hypothetical protein